MKKLRIGIVDIIILLGIIAALLVGLFTAKNFRQTADKQIEATSKITFQVFLRGVTVTGDNFPVKKGSKSFITIRNVPYTELTVIDVIVQPKKIYSPLAKDANKLVIDPGQLAMFDAIITVEDTAKITKDGAVVDGNKIKMGLPVVLEGETYKFGGTISDVRVINNSNIENADENTNIG